MPIWAHSQRGLKVKIARKERTFSGEGLRQTFLVRRQRLNDIRILLEGQVYHAGWTMKFQLSSATGCAGSYRKETMGSLSYDPR